MALAGDVFLQPRLSAAQESLGTTDVYRCVGGRRLVVRSTATRVALLPLALLLLALAVAPVSWAAAPPPPPAPVAFACAAGQDNATCSVLGEIYRVTNGAGWKNQVGWSQAAAGES